MLTTDITKGFYKRIYAGFIKSHKVNQLSIGGEAWFWRVLAVADDFGNTHAEPLLVHQATVGRRTGVTAEMIAGWLEEMHEVGLIQFYADESGDKYLHIIGHEELQPAGKNGKRVKRFPIPDESKIIQSNPDFLNSSLASHSHTQEDTQEEKIAAKKPRPRDPRLDEAAIKAFHEVTERHPPKVCWDRIIKTVGNNPHIERMRECFVTWCSKGFKPTNLDWLFDWYINGIPGGQIAKQQRHETASERNVRNTDDSLAYLRGLPDEGGQVDSESAAGLLTSGS